MITGIDYYAGNGSPTLSGHEFAFIKATEGESMTDPAYTTQRARIKKAGLAFGAYHFGWVNESVDAQAQHFITVARPEPGDMLFLDFEPYPDGRNWGTSWGQRDAWRLAWLAKVKKLAPRCRVGTYCSTSTWKSIPSNDPGDFLFIAQYTTASKPSISHPWLFWQHSDSPVDQDHGNFTDRAALNAWRRAATTETTEDDMPMTKADALTLWKAPLAENVPGKAPIHQAQTYLVDIYQATALASQGVGAAVAELSKQVAALSKQVTALTQQVTALGATHAAAS